MVKLHFLSDKEKELYDKLLEEVIAEKRNDLTGDLRLELFERTMKANEKRKLAGLMIQKLIKLLCLMFYSHYQKPKNGSNVISSIETDGISLLLKRKQRM